MQKRLAYAAPGGLLWTAIRSKTRWNSSVRTAARVTRRMPGASGRCTISRTVFLQDLQGEVTVCHSCKKSLRVVPIVMVHDQEEARRFSAVFSDEHLVTVN